MKILFVCMGNICRSPLAHTVMESLIVEAGREKDIQVDSCGVIGYHAGEPADSRMRKTAMKHGLEITHHSRAIREEDFQEFDLILAMDRGNMRELESFDRGGLFQDKLRYFRELDPEGSGEVPDPYYGGPRGFDLVYEMVERTCRAWLEKL